MKEIENSYLMQLKRIGKGRSAEKVDPKTKSEKPKQIFQNDLISQLIIFNLLDEVTLFHFHLCDPDLSINHLQPKYHAY